MHLCLCHLINSRTLFKDLHYLIANGLEFDILLLRCLIIFDIVVDLARQDKVDIELASVVVLRNQISILELVRDKMVF